MGGERIEIDLGMSTDSSTEWSPVYVIVNRNIRQKEKEKQWTEVVSNAYLY